MELIIDWVLYPPKEAPAVSFYEFRASSSPPASRPAPTAERKADFVAHKYADIAVVSPRTRRMFVVASLIGLGMWLLLFRLIF